MVYRWRPQYCDAIISSAQKKRADNNASFIIWILGTRAISGTAGKEYSLALYMKITVKVACTGPHWAFNGSQNFLIGFASI
jgi:hypothetical protein